MFKQAAVTVLLCISSLCGQERFPDGPLPDNPLDAFRVWMNKDSGRLTNLVRLGTVNGTKPETRSVWIDGNTSNGITFSVPPGGSIANAVRKNPNVDVSWVGMDDNDNIYDVRMSGRVIPLTYPSGGKVYQDFVVEPDVVIFSQTFPPAEGHKMMFSQMITYKKIRGNWTTLPIQHKTFPMPPQMTNPS